MDYSVPFREIVPRNRPFRSVQFRRIVKPLSYLCCLCEYSGSEIATVALSLWRGSATGLTGVIIWALELRDDRLKYVLEKRGLLVKIIDVLKHFPLESVQKLSQVRW